MLDALSLIDTDLFLLINGWHNSFFDVVMVYVSAKFFWIPFYAFLLYLIYMNYGRYTLIILLFIAIMITLTDQGSVHLFKNVFQRLRPCHAPDLKLFVHTVEKCGGQYGFLSSHAANSFALAVFMSALLKNHYRWISLVMFFWAALVIYSRVYLGVHYPGDVLAGAVFGMIIGWFILLLFRFFQKNYPPHKQP
jgi:undecaprenyl-diphosphatase